MSLDTLFSLVTNAQLNPVEDTSLLQGMDANLEKSNTYQWDGAQMGQDVGAVIPVIYGRHLVAPNMINAFIEEGENETLNMLLGVCEGPVESISNIKVNGSRIENFLGENINDPYGENAEVSIRLGEVNQTAINNFDDIHILNPVVETLSKGEPITYTTVADTTEAFKIEFNINRLFQTDSNENQLSWYVAVQIEYKLHTDSDWIFLGVHQFSKNTTSSFKRYFKSDYFAPGKYDIRITRVSDNSDATHTGEIIFNSIDEISSYKLEYPSTALVGMRLIAAERLDKSKPNVLVVVTGKKVRTPDVKDIDGNEVGWEDYYYDNVESRFRLLSNNAVLYWDGTYTIAWSANPVWCLRDFMTNDLYGLGEDITEESLDNASFLASALYCEEAVKDLNGNLEKRLRLDIVYDTQMDALEILFSMCRQFRGLLYLSTSTGKVRLVIEKQQVSEYLFSMGNISKDSFNIRYIPDSAVPNVLHIDYTNKDKNYRRDILDIGTETSIAEGDEFNDRTVQFIGCTRPSQGLREGRILLNKMNLNRIQINFTAGFDARNLQCNNVFTFQHDWPAWGEGGRVKEGSTKSMVKLDKSVNLNLGTDYEIRVKNGNNDDIETRVVSVSDLVTDEVHVTEEFTFVPSDFDIWNFGEVGYNSKDFRIISLNKNKAVDIQAIEYNENAYDHSGIQIPEDNFTYLTLEIPNVSDLTVIEEAVRLGDGTINDVLNISFTKPSTGPRWIKKVNRFEIYLSDDDGISWNPVAQIDKEFYSINKPFTVGTRYTVAVVSVTDDGEKKVPSNSPQGSVLIEGWKNYPAKVSGLSYTFEDEIELTWGQCPDVDLSGYEIRTEDYNWGTQNGNFIWRGKAEKYTIVRPTARSGITYYVKAMNTSGYYSGESTSVSPVNPAPGALSLVYINAFQKAFLKWNDDTDADLVEYEIWINDNSNFTGEETEGGKEKIVAKAQGTSASVFIEYNPSYYRIRGVDKFGPGEWSNIVEVPQVKITGGDVGVGTLTGANIANETLSGEKIMAGTIEAGHIAALAITAEKMNVECLSAISANLGKVTAGEIIGACIKTSEDLYRVELNDTGLYSYDNDGNLTIKMSSGELCLISAECCDFYSYLDHGALKFHHPYGEVPYVKRLCAGEANTGSVVTLCQWYERPEITIGIRKMLSYNSANSVDCQEWCVFADNIRQYNNGGADFGWKFDVHAKLSLSGGVYDEDVWNIGFDITKCSHTNTCEILVKELFQLWCHGASPDNYRYGKSCYEIRYRVSGCGVWCACCYEYIQPHPTVFDIERTYTECQTIGFGCTDTWEIQLHENSLTWLDSGITSGAYCCCLCTYYYDVDCSYWTTYTRSMRKLMGGNDIWVEGTYLTCQCTWIDDESLGSWDEAVKPVCWSCVSYTMCGYLVGKAYGGIFSASVTGEFGGSASISGGGDVNECRCDYYTTGGRSCFGLICNLGVATSIYVYTGYNRSGYVYTGYADTCITRMICYKQCQICCCVCNYYYCIWVGEAECCNYKSFYSQQDVKGTQCVLDPNGVVNYLAVAYA